MKPILVYLPIEVIPSTNYSLVIKDKRNVYHYFNKEGFYDGFSEDCEFSIDAKIVNTEKWHGEKIKCDICNHEWIGVYEESCDRLECPHCHNMVNFEII